MPVLSVTNSFEVTVSELNSAPSLGAIGDVTVDEGTQVSFTAVGSDSDEPADTLSYGLASGFPSGAGIDPVSGQFSWTPDESQGPGVYPIGVVVQDDGVPALSVTNTFTVTVDELNVAPSFVGSPLDVELEELSLLSVPNGAVDTDEPAQVLSYRLLSPPTGASIDGNGLITWTPSESQGPGVYTLTTVAEDDGVPVLSVTNSFEVTVNSVPFLEPLLIRQIDNGVIITWNSVVGRSYSLEYKDDLEVADWVILDGALVGTGDAISVTNAPVESGVRVYRVRAPGVATTP